MAIAIITSKGQVTIPKAVRDALGLRSGDRIEFVEVEAGRYEIVPTTLSVTSLKGLIQCPDKPVSVEGINRAVVTARAKAR